MVVKTRVMVLVGKTIWGWVMSCLGFKDKRINESNDLGVV